MGAVGRRRLWRPLPVQKEGALRERLIAHFAHASAKGEVSWLQTMAKARPRVGWEEAEQCAGLLDEDDEESDGESEIESESDGEDE